jgi:hypothetical protein
MAQDDLLNVYQIRDLQYVASIFFLNSYPHLMLEQHLDDMGVFLSLFSAARYSSPYPLRPRSRMHAAICFLLTSLYVGSVFFLGNLAL